MFDTADATTVIYLGELVKQIFPVSSVLAGIAFGVAFLERSRGTPPLRGSVVNMLTVSSVSFLCAVVASGLFILVLARAEYVPVPPDEPVPVEVARSITSALLETRATDLKILALVSYTGMASGLAFALLALATSGFATSRSDGWFGVVLALTGGAVVVYCVAVAL